MSDLLLEQKDALLSKAEKAIIPWKYVPPKAKERCDFLVSAWNRLPLMAGVLKSGSDSADTIGEVATITTANQLDITPFVPDLQGVSLGISVFNVAFLPLGYAMCWLRDVEPPYRFTDQAKWGYSVVALGLGITALLVPPAAPFIAVAVASGTTALSFFILGKTVYDYLVLRRQLSKANQVLAQCEKDEKDAIAVVERLRKQIADNLADDDEKKAKLERDMARLQAGLDNINEVTERLSEAKAIQMNITTQMKNLNFLSVIDKSVSCGLASLALSGAIISLFFPLPGVIILSTAAGAGLLYAAGRFGIPLAMKFGRWALQKMWPFKKESELDTALPKALSNRPASTRTIGAAITRTPEEAQAALAAMANGHTEAHVPAPGHAVALHAEPPPQEPPPQEPPPQERLTERNEKELTF